MREGWSYKKLGDFTSFQRGLTYSKEDEVDSSSIRVLRSNNITLETSTLNFDDIKCLRSDFTIPQDKMVKKDSILICMSNGSSQHIGKVAYVENDIKYAFGGFMGLIVPSENMFPKFVYYICLSTPYKTFLANIGNGANIKNLRYKDLAELSISLPPLTTQQQIVSELDLLSHILDQKRQQLKEYDALAESIFYDMFGDPVENPKGWEVKKLEEIGFCCSGGTPSRSNDSFFHGTIDWYSAGELNSLFLGESIEKITEDAVNQSAAKLCKVDSLFIGMYDTAAFKLGIATKECCSNQACANICLNEDNVIWLYYTLQQMREEALKNRRGARQKNLNLGYIKSFRVPLPPLTLQRSFAAKIESIEHQKQLLRASIKETEMLFQSRMDYWFNG